MKRRIKFSLAEAEASVAFWAREAELVLSPEIIKELAREALAEDPRTKAELDDATEDAVDRILPEEEDSE